LPLPTVEDCTVLELPKIPDLRGNLSVVEAGRHIPFRIARTYWIYDVPGNATRGGHAYRELEEFMIALSGSFEVRLDDGRSIRSVRLNRSYYGLYVAPGVWRELLDFSTNSVCLVLAARSFEEHDYIREYDRYLEYRGGPA
jgi:hypothetical protein